VGTELHEGLGLGVEAGNVAVDDGLPDDTEGGFGAEEVFVVELLDHFQDVLGGQTGVLDVGHLMPGFVGHSLVGYEAILLRVVEELGAGESVRDGNLNGFHVQRFGKVDGVADRHPGFAGKPQDKVAVDGQTEIVAVLDEGACTFNGCTLLDVLEDLRIARLEADDEQTAARFFHRLQRVVVGSDTGVARPCEAKGLELLAEVDGAGLLDVEGVVVEEVLLYLGEGPLGLCQFRGHIICGALAPGVSAQRLRPEAERALRRAAAGGVERDEGMQQEGHVVARYVQVPHVDLRGPRHCVQIFHLRAVGVVNHLAVFLVADAADFVERLALGKLDYGVLELASADKVLGTRSGPFQGK
jgi:hypothetical protein